MTPTCRDWSRQFLGPTQGCEVKDRGDLSSESRDRGGPRIALQLLNVPELDDRLETPSMIVYTDAPVLNRVNAVISWRHYLRGTVGEIPPYVAPARIANLYGLPPAHIAVAQLAPSGRRHPYVLRARPVCSKES
jgi:hypothetical protein